VGRRVLRYLAGIWLSYGIRKTKLCLTDLVSGEDDRLLPQIRLLFAGSLAFVIGLMLVLGFVDLRVGTLRLAKVAAQPDVAFLFGLFLGIGELALPASLGRPARTLTAVMK
jgi:hypothetical protein